MSKPQELFWQKVEKTSTCWNWTAYKDPRGYGRLTSLGKPWMAHRLSYELSKGPIPDGMYIDHQCHNPACVNPDHLVAVKAKENSENRAGADVRNRSGIRGVGWSERLQFWYVQVKHRGVNHYTGKFRTAAHAERAAIMKRLELFSNSVKDRRIPENIESIHNWHTKKHLLEWKSCPVEPCNLLHEDFRDAWS